MAIDPDEYVIVACTRLDRLLSPACGHRHETTLSQQPSVSLGTAAAPCDTRHSCACSCPLAITLWRQGQRAHWVAPCQWSSARCSTSPNLPLCARKTEVGGTTTLIRHCNCHFQRRLVYIHCESNRLCFRPMRSAAMLLLQCAPWSTSHASSRAAPLSRTPMQQRSLAGSHQAVSTPVSHMLCEGTYP